MLYNIKMVLNDETKWAAYGQCRVIEVYGYNNNAAADRYIQFHEKPLVAASDVPAVASLYAPTAAPFAWKFENPISLSELTIAISSTQINYTALTNTGLDMTVVIETDFAVNSATTLVGDLSTSVAAREIWADSAGPKKLMRLDFYNGDASTVYPVIRAGNSNLSGDSTVKIMLPVATTATGTFFFGRNGYSPFRNNGAGTDFDGCTVHCTFGGTYAGAPISATNFNIRAIYE